MEPLNWMWAAIALGSGLLIGEIAGRLARRALEGRAGVPRTSNAARREFAGLVGTILFWLATAVGLVVAIGVLDPNELDDLGEQLAEIVPRLAVAALLLIGGHAVAVTLAAMVGQSVRKATGVRQRTLERALQAAILATAVVVALAALGVQPALIVVPLAVLLAAPALAFALLSGLGGRDVAGQLAAGRALRHQLRDGMMIECGAVTGVIVALHATTVEVERHDGSRTHLPNGWLLAEPFSVSG
jgi:hypothetical protein